MTHREGLEEIWKEMLWRKGQDMSYAWGVKKYIYIWPAEKEKVANKIEGAYNSMKAGCTNGPQKGGYVAAEESVQLGVHGNYSAVNDADAFKATPLCLI